MSDKRGNNGNRRHAPTHGRFRIAHYDMKDVYPARTFQFGTFLISQSTGSTSFLDSLYPNQTGLFVSEISFSRGVPTFGDGDRFPTATAESYTKNTGRSR